MKAATICAASCGPDARSSSGPARSPKLPSALTCAKVGMPRSCSSGSSLQCSYEHICGSLWQACTEKRDMGVEICIEQHMVCQHAAATGLQITCKLPEWVLLVLPYGAWPHANL